MRINLRIASVVLFAELCFMPAGAQPSNNGCELLKRSKELYKLYRVDYTSISRDSLVNSIDAAVEKLRQEGNESLEYSGLILLAQLYSDEYATLFQSARILNSVLKEKHKLSPNDMTLATCLRASLLMTVNPNTVFPRLLGRSVDLKTLDNKEDVIFCAQILANSAFWAGETTVSNAYYNAIYNLLKDKERIQIADKNELVAYIMAVTDYVYILFSRGSNEEAFNIINHCWAIIKEHDLQKSFAYTSFLRTYGSIEYFLLRDYGSAIASFESAATILFNYSGESSTEAIECIRSLAEVYASKGESRNALKCIDYTLDKINKNVGPSSFVACHLVASRAKIYAIMQDYERASNEYHIVANMADSLHYYEPQIFTNLATCLNLAGHRKEAIKYAGIAIQRERTHIYESFLSLAEKGRESYWAIQSRICFRPLANIVSTTEDNSGLLYDIALISKGLLTDSSAHFLDFISSHADETLKAKWNEYLEVQQSLGDMIVSSSEDEQIIDSLKMRLATLEAEMMYYARRVGSPFPGITGTWQQVENVLTASDASVELTRYTERETGKPRYIASVLRKGGAPVNISLDNFDEDQIQRTPFNRIYKTTTLYEILISPIEPYLKGVDRIYFSPDGLINSIALENIPTPSGKTMGEEYSMLRLSTTRQLISPVPSEPWSSAALLGGFNYNLGIDEMEYYAETMRERGGNESMHSWRYLPGSLEEIEIVNGLLKTLNPIVIQGEEGVEESFKSLSGKQINLIHIATHGYYDKHAVTNVVQQSDFEEEQLMEASGLVFSGANNHEQVAGVGEGLLSAREISRLNLIGCDLIVLSSCGSGLGITSFANENYGLVRAFKKAGCRSILMSLWDIDDTASRHFMEFFYKAKLDGASNDEAIVKARSNLKEKYKEPKYWAPFVLID